LGALGGPREREDPAGSQRLLARFPEASCIAVDMDPVMLVLG
jgi:hypothetical protein